MPIPPFDVHGNLGVGDYLADASLCLIPATLREIRRRFVSEFQDDSKRSEIFEGWMKYRTEFNKLGLEYHTWVDGSFTTNKYAPGDIDVALVMDGDKVDQLRGAKRRRYKELFDVDEMKRLYFVHPQQLPMWPFGHPLFEDGSLGHGYWTRVFGTARGIGSHKAILVVRGGGVL